MKLRTPQIALACALFALGNYASANVTKNTEYPTYQAATGVSARNQIPMEALWLHLNATHTGNVTIPKSFDMTDYWTYMAVNNQTYKAYRQTNDNGTCNVISGHENDATVERAMQQQGLDIYDGAVWQIALSLAAKINPQEYLKDVYGYQNFLMNGLSGGFLSYYANKNYSYNGTFIPSEKNAYLLKFISPSWASNYDSLNNCNMQWPEWSAVTGEEAWAVLIGPIQSIYILNDGANNPDWSSTSQAGAFIQLGKNALSAIKAMQAPSGGVYRNVAMPGESQNLDISLENNFSLYAGLSMLEEALKARDENYKSQLKSSRSMQVQQTLSSDEDDIKTINQIKQKMVQFFAGLGGVAIYNREGNYFYSSVNGNEIDTKNFAVDVQTWGAAVIASSKKDPNDPNDPDLLQAMTDAYGKDMMFNMLQSALRKSAYNDQNNNLLGVGYTEQTAKDDFYELSGEWTLGAVNAAIVLADYYKNDSEKSALLISQAGNMLNGLIKETSNLQGKDGSATARLSYLYANKRTFIPFGWFSNKAPSTASTAWSLMVNSCYNPLELGGGNYKNVCGQLKLTN